MKEYLLYTSDFNKYKRQLDGRVFHCSFNEINDTIRRVKHAAPAELRWDRKQVEDLLNRYDITPYLKILADNKNKP